MSRARGRPYWIDGIRYEGPQALRDERRVMGLPWVKGQDAALVRQGNRMALRSVNRCKDLQGRFFSLEHPRRSWLWYMQPAGDGVYAAVFSHCCFGGRRRKWTMVLTNSYSLYKALNHPECEHDVTDDYAPYWSADHHCVIYPTEEEAEYPWGLCLLYVEAARELLVLDEHVEKVMKGIRIQAISQELSNITAQRTLSSGPFWQKRSSNGRSKCTEERNAAS